MRLAGEILAGVRLGPGGGGAGDNWAKPRRIPRQEPRKQTSISIVSVDCLHLCDDLGKEVREIYNAIDTIDIRALRESPASRKFCGNEMKETEILSSASQCGLRVTKFTEQQPGSDIESNVIRSGTLHLVTIGKTNSPRILKRLNYFKRERRKFSFFQKPKVEVYL